MDRSRAGVAVHLDLLLLIAVLMLTCAPVAVQAVKPSCGDGRCTGGETYVTCPEDCAEPSVCGDGICSEDEDCASCEADCGACPAPVCNDDGTCNDGEDCINCPGDCPGVTGGKPSLRFCCGLDTFDEALCGADCGIPISTVCGNGILEDGEECDDGNTTSGDGCSAFCMEESAPSSVPANQFNIGDSIGEGEAADGTIGEPHHETVSTTGYALDDIVFSLNERLEDEDAEGYYENDAERDNTFNRAISGSVMADFASQAQEVVDSIGAVPADSVGMVSILLGNNDVCADSLDAMTDPQLFEDQYRTGLDILAAHASTRDAAIQVSSIPAIYWLWEAKRENFLCRVFIWPFVPCQNLLDNPSDDCVSDASRLDPDVIYDGDGPNCQRRKQFHARIRDDYNPVLRDVLQEYRDQGKLPNAQFIDLFGVRFEGLHVNDGDCFHPSEAGHALLANEQWCRSGWGAGDPFCSP